MLTIEVIPDEVHPKRLFLWDGEPVGSIHWSTDSWIWCLLDGDVVRESVNIDVDPEQREQFISERQSAAKLDEPIRDVIMAELEGRLRLFRDETLDMAIMYGRARARTIGRYRRARTIGRYRDKMRKPGSGPML